MLFERFDQVQRARPLRHAGPSGVDVPVHVQQRHGDRAGARVRGAPSRAHPRNADISVDGQAPLSPAIRHWMGEYGCHEEIRRSSTCCATHATSRRRATLTPSPSHKRVYAVGSGIRAQLMIHGILLLNTCESSAGEPSAGSLSGIHWPALDQDIFDGRVVEGAPSGESAASFERWLSRHGPAKRQQPRKARRTSSAKRSVRERLRG